MPQERLSRIGIGRIERLERGISESASGWMTKKEKRSAILTVMTIGWTECLLAQVEKVFALMNDVG